MTADLSAIRIDLTREENFRLGGLLVQPATRQVEFGGTAETLEPRIMQVLVALARKRGQVVSRDELIETCWEGRVVGDDALNRCVAKIRKLGEVHSAFRLETIPRVGYRLWVEEGKAGQAAPAVRKRFNFRNPVHALAAVLLAAIAAAGIYLAVLYSRVAAVTVAPSVAVMPFVDRIGDQAHLAGGMTDELISRLRQMEGISVAGGDWMAGVLKEAGDPQAVGKRLSVNHLLEGSVRRDGNRLRVSARLSSTLDGRVQWAEEYEKEVSDIFEVQNEIARSVANALSVVLDTGLQSSHSGGTSNFEAYDHYLRGRELRNSRPTDRVIGELRRAVTIDPDYARAWFELTIALGGEARLKTSMADFEPILREMDETSKRAQSLAPEAWFGHAARGWYHIGRNEWLAADQALQRAFATGMREPDLYVAVLSFHAQVGRHRKVLQLHDQMVQLDPYTPERMQRHSRLMNERNYEGAWKAFKEDVLQKLEPGESFNDFTMAMLALSVGDQEIAKPYFRTVAPEKAPDGTTLADYLDSPREGLLFIRPILDAPAGRATRETYFFAALLAAHFGDTELALEFLRRAYLGPGWAAQFFLWHPLLRETRRTEGFKKFVTDLGLVDMWRASGDWGDYCRPLGDTDFECS